MGNTAHRIGQIHLVMVPSSDQDRSVAFYEALGFATQADADFGDGQRWIEMVPPDGRTGVALVPGRPEAAGTQTGIVVTTGDIDATHAQLLAEGHDVDPAIARAGSPARITLGGVSLTEPWPPMFYLRDPDGNALLVVG